MLDILLKLTYDKSPQLILDNFGIRVNVVEDVPSYAKMREAQRQAYGFSFFERFWKQHIFPFLFPEKHKILIDRYDALVIECRREFLNAILEQC